MRHVAIPKGLIFLIILHRRLCVELTRRAGTPRQSSDHSTMHRAGKADNSVVVHASDSWPASGRGVCLAETLSHATVPCRWQSVLWMARGARGVAERTSPRSAPDNVAGTFFDLLMRPGVGNAKCIPRPGGGHPLAHIFANRSTVSG